MSEASGEGGAEPVAPPKRTRRFGLSVVLVALLAATAGASAAILVLGDAMRSREELVANAQAPPPIMVTVAAQQRELASEVVFRGTVDTAGQVELTLPQTVHGVVTAVNLADGEAIEAGSVPLEVQGRPVIAVPGDFRFYRNMRPGDTGPDVRQLEQALADLGLLGYVDSSFGAATQAAIRNLYARHGYAPPMAPAEGGSARGGAKPSGGGAAPVSQTPKQDTTQPDGQSETDNGGSDGQSGQDTARSDARSEQDTTQSTGQPAKETTSSSEQPPQKTTHSGDAGGGNTAQSSKQSEPEMVVIARASELWALPELPRPVDDVTITVGDELPKTSFGVYRGSVRLSGSVPRERADQAVPGAAVVVSDGEHEWTGEVVTPSSRDSRDDGKSKSRRRSGRGVPVLVQLDDESVELSTGRSYQITLLGESTDGAVLAVPLGAVSQRPDGTTIVRIPESDGGAEPGAADTDPGKSAVRPVRVELGIRADGWVQVLSSEGDALSEGTPVVIGAGGIVAAEGGRR